MTEVGESLVWDFVRFEIIVVGDPSSSTPVAGLYLDPSHTQLPIRAAKRRASSRGLLKWSWDFGRSMQSNTRTTICLRIICCGEEGAGLTLMLLKRAREAVYNLVGLIVLARAGYALFFGSPPSFI